MRFVLSVLISFMALGCSNVHLYPHIHDDGDTGDQADTSADYGVPTARFQHAMIFDEARQETLLIGGYNGWTSELHDQMWAFDGSGWTEVLPGNSAAFGNPWNAVGYELEGQWVIPWKERRTHAVAYDAQREVVVLFGGLTAGQYRDDTWEWNGSSWRHIETIDPEGDGNPPPVIDHKMVYDEARGVVVLIGGRGNPNQTWEYDGRSWALQADWSTVDAFDREVPNGRFRHALAYDAAREVTVLFGGLSGWGEYHDTTWEYDGDRWSLSRIEDPEGDGNPSAVADAAMVYDIERGVIVLFSGFKGGEAHSDQTWEYDGFSWRLVSPTDPEADGNPAARNTHAMAYDPIAGRTVLFGGYSSILSQETWTWDGRSWELQ
jgi:hypothetical protein